MTEDAIRTLRALADQGGPGRIEAVRVYPHKYRFKIPRDDRIGSKDVTLSAIDQLMRAKFIVPIVDGSVVVSASVLRNVETLDRYEYMITDDGKEYLGLLDAEAAEMKRMRAGKS